MLEEFKQIYDFYNITEENLKIAEKIEKDLEERFKNLDEIKLYNQMKVLKAMQEARLSDIHFGYTTGYGYDDAGREKVEQIFANVFGAEDALVRTGIVNGTHALTICLQALLYPGDTMLSITSKPYDTLDSVIGIEENDMSLKAYNINYKQVELKDNNYFDKDAIKKELEQDPTIKMVYIQRSKGYSRRKSLTVSDIKDIAKFVKDIKPNVIIMTDNCYGEFIDRQEPTEVGVDVMAGSLIKNPGGGLALSGGYIAGKKDLIEKCAKRLTSPAIGKECGLTFDTNRTVLQGLFLAPAVVSNALKGAIFVAKLFSENGYDVFPSYDSPRSDIIQAVGLNSGQEMVEFCKAIQNAAPVDSYVTPEPWAMPGYTSQVVMASGSFVAGSSIELSADGPIREPYTVYFQGGLTYEHSKLGALMAFNAVENYR